ncbi:MAG: hypothetical protein ABI810_05125 [Sphingomonas bacterium]
MNRFSCAALLALALAACSGGSSGSGNASAPVSMAPGSSIEKTPVATIGMTVLGEILPNGPSNFYRFDNPAKLRDLVTVRLENKSATLRPEIRVYNAHRAQLLNMYNRTAGASVEQRISLDPGQTIYVEVGPSNSIGAYQLSALARKAYDANEPNDDQLTPTPLKWETPIDGNIMDGKDTDWFHLGGAKGGKVQVVLENQSATLRPHIKIYSATKSRLSEKYDGAAGAGLDFMLYVEPGKDLYVQVVPNGSEGRYRLMVRALG